MHFLGGAPYVVVAAGLLGCWWAVPGLPGGSASGAGGAAAMKYAVC